MNFSIQTACLTALFLISLAGKQALAEPVWPKLNEPTLEVESESALDFSGFNQLMPISNEDRIVISATGKLVLQSAPTTPLRFFAAALGFGAATGGFPTKGNIDKYIQQLVLRGYNAARLDFVEDTLVAGQKANLTFDPIQLDRFHYLLASLKKAGIYYVLNILSAPDGAYAQDRWIGRRNIPFAVYLQPEMQQHWRWLVDALFVPKNPYTSTSVLQDPALLAATLVNENSLVSYADKIATNTAWQLDFQNWMRLKYGSVSRAHTAWKSAATSTDEAWAAFKTAPTAMSAGQRSADTLRYFNDKELQLSNAMRAHLQSRGFKGIPLMFNHWLTVSATDVRSTMPAVEMHNYHDHPSNWIESGSKIEQSSVIKKTADYIRQLAVTRVANRPFLVTEHGIPFWSHRRYEAVGMFPAYAALQNWDLICQHSYAVTLQQTEGGGRGKGLLPFMVGSDPIARAQEVLSTLIYRRADVAQSKNSVTLHMDRDQAYERYSILSEFPYEAGRISLLTGANIALVDATASKAPKTNEGNTYDVSPANATSVFLSKVTERLNTANIRTTPNTGLIKAMAADGAISRLQLEALDKGTYRSDTGQLNLSPGEGVFTVVTPLTEVISLVDAKAAKADKLSIQHLSRGATIALSSLDRQELQASKRLLLIIASDAKNSNMRFADRDETILESIGSYPVLLAPVKLEFSFASRGKSFSVYALAASGKRLEKIATARAQNQIVNLALDTEKTPTVYFELVDDSVNSEKSAAVFP